MSDFEARIGQEFLIVARKIESAIRPSKQLSTEVEEGKLDADIQLWLGEAK